MSPGAAIRRPDTLLGVLASIYELGGGTVRVDGLIAPLFDISLGMGRWECRPILVAAPIVSFRQSCMNCARCSGNMGAPRSCRFSVEKGF